jgi:hypothetical protein
MPGHDHEVHVTLLSDLCELGACLASGDFELKMHARTECPARDHTIHKFFGPGRPFMMRLVHVEWSRNAPTRLGPLLAPGSNVESDYFRAGALRHIGRRDNRGI